MFTPLFFHHFHSICCQLQLAGMAVEDGTTSTDQMFLMHVMDLNDSLDGIESEEDLKEFLPEVQGNHGLVRGAWMVNYLFCKPRTNFSVRMHILGALCIFYANPLCTLYSGNTNNQHGRWLKTVVWKFSCGWAIAIAAWRFCTQSQPECTTVSNGLQHLIPKVCSILNLFWCFFIDKTLY